MAASEKDSNKPLTIPGIIRNLVDADRLLEEGIPDRIVPKALFIAFLALVYIANSHFADKTTVKLNRLKQEAEDLRVEFHISQAEYMFQSKQSEVAKKLQPAGIVESRVPPKKIRLEE